MLNNQKFLRNSKYTKNITFSILELFKITLNYYGFNENK